MSGERALEILGNIHAVGSLYEKRKMEWNLNEVDQDAEQLMDDLTPLVLDTNPLNV